MAIGRIPEPGTGIQESIVDAKGDLISATGNDAPARLAVGADGTTLVANSATATGLEWAAPAGGSTYKGVSLYNTPDTQSINNNTATALTFDEESFDTDAFHNNSTNTSRITIPVGLAGKYLITAHVMYDLNATVGRFLNVYKNGSNIANGADILGSNSVYTANNISVVLSLAEGDYIELFTRQTSGDALAAYKRQLDNAFTATYLGA